MERRDLFAAIAVATALGLAPQAFAQGASSMHPPKYKALEESSARCVAAANDCLRHCMGMLAMKDSSMAGCTDAAYQIVAACGALQTLAAVNSPHVPAFAKAVGAVCMSCKTECDKFPNVAECKACGAACQSCADECHKVSA
ncbi:MAG TPA: four-helix bundle copper-binding protein [Acetobacteraceae bacterium]|nr:four-helix bundle copper-binding protein [Acetobacteraceae bacterium]